MKEERKQDRLFSQHSIYIHTFIRKLKGSETKESHISIILKQKTFFSKMAVSAKFFHNQNGKAMCLTKLEWKFIKIIFHLQYRSMFS
jgi:hypothetical protein